MDGWRRPNLLQVVSHRPRPGFLSHPAVHRVVQSICNTSTSDRLWGSSHCRGILSSYNPVCLPIVAFALILVCLSDILHYASFTRLNRLKMLSKNTVPASALQADGPLIGGSCTTMRKSRVSPNGKRTTPKSGSPKPPHWQGTCCKSVFLAMRAFLIW
jgi:hypothetical protein